MDTIDNLPRLRLSGSMMKVILWLLREVGVKHVPSYDKLRKVQKKVREDDGVPTVHWMSPKGNAFSFNDLRAIITNLRMPQLTLKFTNIFSRTGRTLLFLQKFAAIQ